MKKALNTALTFVKSHFAKVVLGLSILLVFSQFVSLTHELALYSTSEEILHAVDGDAAAAIEVARRTRWYNDNGWSAYGPLYYRITHTLESLAPLVEKSSSVHFHLILVSLIFAYFLGWILLSALNLNWTERFLGLALFIGALFQQKEWVQMTYRAHPDLLLSFCAGLSFLLMLRLREFPYSRSLFGWTCFAIAAGFLTKFTFAFFLPSLIFLFLTQSQLKPHWRRCLGWSLGIYFLLGFPQSFRLVRDLKFLLYQSQYSRSPDLASVNEWLHLAWDQFWRPALVLLFLFVLFHRFKSENSSKLSLKNILVVGLGILFPFLVLTSRKIISPHDYYTLPFVAVFLVGWIWVLRGISLPFSNWEKGRSFLVFLLIVLGAKAPIFVPSEMNHHRLSQEKCMGQAKEFNTILRRELEQGKVLFMDPYTPHPREKNFKDQWRGGWSNNWGLVEKDQPDLLILYRPYYARFLKEDKLDYVKIDVKDVDSSISYYKSFGDGETVLSPSGIPFHRVSQYSCGWTMWERQ